MSANFKMWLISYFRLLSLLSRHGWVSGQYLRNGEGQSQLFLLLQGEFFCSCALQWHQLAMVLQNWDYLVWYCYYNVLSHPIKFFQEKWLNQCKMIMGSCERYLNMFFSAGKRTKLKHRISLDTFEYFIISVQVSWSVCPTYPPLGKINHLGG